MADQTVASRCWGGIEGETDKDGLRAPISGGECGVADLRTALHEPKGRKGKRTADHLRRSLRNHFDVGGPAKDGLGV